MSDYPQYPTDPSNPSGATAYGAAPATRGPRPSSVDLAVKLIWANIALSLVSALVTFVMMDTIIDQQMESSGVSSEMVNADTVRSAAMVGAVIGLVIGVALYALMAVFISKGANWARIVYTVLAVIGLLSGVVGLGAQPAILLIISIISMVLTIAVVVLLWRGESNAWFKAR